MAYVSPANLATGDVAPESWFDAVKAATDFLANPPKARVYHSTFQAITNTTLTALAFNTERYDTDTIHDTVTNNSRLTCKTAGTYHIQGTISWEAAAAGTYRLCRIRLNGTTLIASSTYAPSAFAAVSNDHIVSTDYALAVNDYVELVVQHNAGAGGLQVLSTANMSPEFIMRWVSL
jgi:hypothetical protein